MKYVCILLTTVILLGTYMRSNAQVALGVSVTSVSSSTPNLGSQLSVFAELKNYSATDTFTGIINFKLANQDSIITNINVVGMPTFAGTSITLAPLQTRSALFTVQLLPSYFKVGPDIIIVWPVASSVLIVDSGRAPINILAPLGIADVSADDVHAFAFQDQFIIQNRGLENGLKQVQIYDLTGRELISCPVSNADTRISLNNLPKGVYIAEISFNDGQTKRVKFTR